MEASATELKLKVAKLEKELLSAKSSTGNTEDKQKLVLLENLLQDSNKMKLKFEEDHIKSHQKNITLQAEIDRLKAGTENFES